MKKNRKTPTQNKWTQGAYYHKQIARLVTCGMKLQDAETFARKQREEN